MAVDFTITGGPKAVTFRGNFNTGSYTGFVSDTPGKRKLGSTTVIPPNQSIDRICCTFVLPDGDYSFDHNNKSSAPGAPNTLGFVDGNGGSSAALSAEISA